jgi:hypothetical protein
MKPEELEGLLRRIPELEPAPDLEDRIRSAARGRRPFRVMLPVAASLIFCLAGLWLALFPSPQAGGRGKPDDSSLSIRVVHEGTEPAERCRDVLHWSYRVQDLPVASPEALETLLQARADGERASAKRTGRSELRVVLIGDAATPWEALRRARTGCGTAGIYKIEWCMTEAGKKDQVHLVWIPAPRDPKPPEKVVLEPIRVLLRWGPGRNELVRSIGERRAATSDEGLLECVRRMIDDYRSAGKTEFPIYIEAKPDVPWKDVSHIVEICRNAGFVQVEFDYTPPPVHEIVPKVPERRTLPPPKDD